MNDSNDASLPRKLLLATDLSARCDRPLERARQLAAQWQASLDLLTVREGPQVPAEVVNWLAGSDASTEAEFAARRDIARDFEGCGFPVSLHFADGDVADAVQQAATRMDSALVIAGAARINTLGEMFLGSTVERLARTLGRPLLVVRQRARAPYHRILVPTDFSAAARLALQTAARLFPEAQLIVFHAHEPGINALAEGAPAGNGALRLQCEQFVDACGLPPQLRARIVIDSAPGAPEGLVTRYVREHAVDLAVLGLHGQAGVLRMLLGSKGEQLLRGLDCDTLLVCTGDADADG